jgi:hypothetical protein
MPAPQAPVTALPDAVTKVTVDFEAQLTEDSLIIEKLIQLTTDFLSITTRDTLLGKGDPNPDPYKPSLGNLFARLEAGRLPPSPVDANGDTRKTDRIRKRTSKSLQERPLTDFEDIYYALLALTQEMYSLLRMRINNNFNSLDDPIFEGGHPISQVMEFLVSTWEFLNMSTIAKALDDAVRKASFQKTKKRFSDDLKEGLYTVEDVDELVHDLEEPSTYATIPGLKWIGGWSPAMINIMLEQKYRRIFSSDRKEKVKKARDGAIRKRKAKAEVERELKKRLSAERVQREELLKAQLQEEVKSRHAQLQTQVPVQTPLRHEQQSEEEKMAARASLVSSYMSDLWNKASPHAKRLMHDTLFNNTPPVYRGPSSPSGYSIGSSPRVNNGSALKHGFVAGDRIYDGQRTPSGSEALRFHGGAPAQVNTTGQYSQQGFGASVQLGNDVFGLQSDRGGFTNHMDGSYTSPCVPQRSFMSNLQKDEKGMGLTIHKGFLGSSPTGRLVYPCSDVRDGYTSQIKRHDYVAGVPYHGNQEYASCIDHVSHQNVAMSDIAHGNAMDHRFGIHNAQNGNMLGAGSGRSINIATYQHLQGSGDVVHNLSGPGLPALTSSRTQDTSTYLAQQGFQWPATGAGIGQTHEGGNSIGVDIEMDMGGGMA